MRLVEYDGKSMSTIFDDESTQEEFENIQKEYFTMPDFEDVKKEIKGVIKDRNERKPLTNKYFLQKVHDKVIVKGCRWSVKDLFDCKSVFDIFYSKVQKNEKVFPPKDGLLNNVLTAVRIGGVGIVRHATFYPLESVRYIVGKYCKKGGNYYDYSCGWGDRLLGSLSMGVNYYGTDPNFELTEQLNKIYETAKEVCYLPNTAKIYTQGSENFIPELEGKIDLAFSSPPYFDLEDYKIGDQSFKEGTTYENWLKGYMKQTMENIYKYLKEDGYFAINIKNSKEHALMDDCIKLAEEVGFKFLKFEELENITRYGLNGKIDNSEKIAILSKSAELPAEEIKEELW